METLPADVLDLVLDRAGSGGRVRAGSSSTYLRDRVADFTPAANSGSPPTASDIFLRVDAERVWTDKVCVAGRLEPHGQSTGVKFHFGSFGSDTVQMFTLPVHGETGVTVTWRRVPDTVTLSVIGGGCRASRPSGGFGASRWKMTADDAVDHAESAVELTRVLKQWFPTDSVVPVAPRSLRPPRFRWRHVQATCHRA